MNKTLEEKGWEALTSDWISEALESWQFGHRSGREACQKVLEKCKKCLEGDRFALLAENAKLRNEVFELKKKEVK
jgi:hypothetical protein